jgi:hypothetical protein
MDEKIRNLVPIILEEIQSDRENDSQELLAYYVGCNTQEKAAVNNVMIYLCGWSFETILEKCGIAVDEKGDPVSA